MAKIDYSRAEVIEALEYLLSPVCTETQFDYCDEIRAAIALLNEQDKQLTMAKNLLKTIADQDTNWTTYIRYHLTWKPPEEEEAKAAWYQADGWCEANEKALEQEPPKEEEDEGC